MSTNTDPVSPAALAAAKEIYEVPQPTMSMVLNGEHPTNRRFKTNAAIIDKHLAAERQRADALAKALDDLMTHSVYAFMSDDELRMWSKKGSTVTRVSAVSQLQARTALREWQQHNTGSLP